MVTIDRRLNLVIPLERETGTIYVHSTPLRREIFDRYYLVFAKTFTRIFAEGLTYLSGPRVAATMLRDVAKSTITMDRSSNMWDGPEGVEQGLLPAIRQATNVLLPQSGGGWAPEMFDNVINQQLLDEDEMAEVDAAITFFIVNSAMQRRAMLGPILQGAAGMWGWQITSLGLSDFRSSLMTSTQADDTTQTAKALFIPS